MRTWFGAALGALLVCPVIAGCGGSSANQEGAGRETKTVAATQTQARPTTKAPAKPKKKRVLSPEARARRARARAAADIVDRLCARSRAKTLYRAPGLFRGGQAEDPFANTYLRMIDQAYAGATAKGFERVAKVGCRTLRVLGAVKYFSLDASGERAGRWVFVAGNRGSSVRGWAYLLSGSGIDWSKARVVEAAVLYRAAGKQLPDVTFGTYRHRYEVGDRCDSPLTANDYVLVARNEGPGLGARKLTLRAAGYKHDETKSFRFARAMLPGETVTLSVFNGAQLELDPRGRLKEANEGNNRLKLPFRQPPLRCGGK